jgi:hypothetical protein
VPPRRFWNAGFRTDEGKLRANQWFEGYRHGARVAREGGYRERATLHSSVTNCQSDRHILVDQREPTGSGVENPFTRPQGSEALPAPVELPAKDVPVKPPSENKPEARPEDTAPPVNDAVPDELKKTLPLEEPVTVTPSTIEPAAIPILAGAEQQSKVVGTAVSGPAPTDIRASAPNSVAGSAVCFVSGTKRSASDADASALTPAASPKSTASAGPKPFDGAEIPLLTPRVRAASSQLFGR